MLRVVVGFVLMARGVLWVSLMRRAKGPQDRARRWDKRTVRRILVVRGVGSIALGFTIAVELWDIAIILAIVLLMWELSHLRRRRAAA